MIMSEILDVKTDYYNIQNSIFMLKNQLAVCGSQLSDNVQENIVNRIFKLEETLEKKALLIEEYEKQLGC